MPTVRRFDRCRIEMYFDDHPPPHFHIITRRDERVAVIIETLAVLVGKADPRDTEEAYRWAGSNRAELWARWIEYSEDDDEVSQ
jgi:hypothetical protein